MKEFTRYYIILSRINGMVFVCLVQFYSKFDYLWFNALVLRNITMLYFAVQFINHLLCKPKVPERITNILQGCIKLKSRGIHIIHKLMLS